jgi:hypothetical protein
VKVRAKWILAALTALPLVGAAADEPKQSCINNFTFSPDFLHRHPKAGGACREVIVKDGQKWARFDAQVVDIQAKGQSREVTVDFLDSAGRPVESISFTAPQEARVVVNGRDMTYGALGKGDDLSFWIPESRAGVFAAPGATQLKEIVVARAD